MSHRFERRLALTGTLAVVLWIVGLVVAQGMSDSLSDKATDAQILAWAKSNTNTVLMGSWLFMVGCVVFIWFVDTIRTRLASVEETGTVATIAFGGGIATAILGMLVPAGDAVVAIDKNDISASSAGALHHLTDLFFVGAELAAIALLSGVAVAAFRTGVLPKWWAAFSALVAVVLVIGPIGWAALIFGLPIWTLGTSLLLARVPAARRTRVGEAATA
jgi:hypothetical protein